jgi:hypothetical protein
MSLIVAAKAKGRTLVASP